MFVPQRFSGQTASHKVDKGALATARITQQNQLPVLVQLRQSRQAARFALLGLTTHHLPLPALGQQGGINSTEFQPFIVGVGRLGVYPGQGKLVARGKDVAQIRLAQRDGICLRRVVDRLVNVYFVTGVNVPVDIPLNQNPPTLHHLVMTPLNEHPVPNQHRLKTGQITQTS